MNIHPSDVDANTDLASKSKRPLFLVHLQIFFVRESTCKDASNDNDTALANDLNNFCVTGVTKQEIGAGGCKNGNNAYRQRYEKDS